MIQRDNVITEQEARIKSLEKGLARYLKSQVCSSGPTVIIEQMYFILQSPKFTAGSDAHSILNLTKFALSSSPPRPKIDRVDRENAVGRPPPVVPH